MALLFKLSLAMAITASLVIAPLFANALSYDPVLDPTRPYFYDLNGVRLHSIEEGKQVMITTTFTNRLEEELAFVGMLEVRDADGVTVLLAWQSGTVEPLGNKTIGVSWVVQESSGYQARTLAITNFENPQVLSNVESSEIEP